MADKTLRAVTIVNIAVAIIVGTLTVLNFIQSRAHSDGTMDATVNSKLENIDQTLKRLEAVIAKHEADIERLNVHMYESWEEQAKNFQHNGTGNGAIPNNNTRKR